MNIGNRPPRCPGSAGVLLAWARPIAVPLVLLAAAAACGASGSNMQFLPDPIDAAWRRTDIGIDDPIAMSPAQIPDLLSTMVCAWSTPTPSCDPYVGEPVVLEGAHLFRIDLVVRGLVNPPGPIGGPAGFSPTLFGPSPLYGFVELDVDQDVDTGGEDSAAAAFRFTAIAGRFGGRPTGPSADRIVTQGSELDFDWTTPPFYERSGQDFALAMCGCMQPELVSQSGNKNGIFESGEVFILRGRFFQRAGGYRESSAMFGGSSPGRWDPMVNLRFAHDPAADVTTISFVGALDMQGAAMLIGEPEQAIDNILELNGNHTSVLEALTDLVANAENGVSPLAHELTRRWAGRNPADALNPLNWGVRALLGCSYADQVSHDDNAFFAWSDIAFDSRFGDLDGDGFITADDRSIVSSTIDTLDGGPSDADQALNGSVQIPDFGPNFLLADITGDGLVDQADLAWYPVIVRCAADWNDSGEVSVQDLFDFLASWFSGTGDFNRDGVNGVQDLFDFLAVWFVPCQ